LALQLQHEWEAIDALRREGFMLADKKCRKLHMGAVPWSPDIQQAREHIEIWGLILKKKLGRHICSYYNMACSNSGSQIIFGISLSRRPFRINGQLSRSTGI
jgi:hypothetical protein